MIIQFTDKGNLRSILSSNFKNILWKDKIYLLQFSAFDLKGLHELGYFHKDFHSGISYQEVYMIMHMFQTLDYLDQQMNKNQMIKYVESYLILPQKS